MLNRRFCSLLCVLQSLNWNRPPATVIEAMIISVALVLIAMATGQVVDLFEREMHAVYHGVEAAEMELSKRVAHQWSRREEAMQAGEAAKWKDVEALVPAVEAAVQPISTADVLQTLSSADTNCSQAPDTTGADIRGVFDCLVKEIERPEAPRRDRLPAM
jgi:hypothetical protein